MALAARSDGPGHHALLDRIAGHAGIERFDHADRFMAYREALRHRIFALHDVHVGAAVVVVVIRTSASPALGLGMGFSSRTMRPGP